MPNKALEIFNDKELNKHLSTNQQVAEILIDLLGNKRVHEGVVKVFESFLTQCKATKDRRRELPDILIDKVIESLHLYLFFTSEEAVSRANDPSLQEKFNQINANAQEKNLIMVLTLKEEILIKKETKNFSIRFKFYFYFKIKSYHF